jgi:hypothetical protein
MPMIGKATAVDCTILGSLLNIWPHTFLTDIAKVQEKMPQTIETTMPTAEASLAELLGRLLIHDSHGLRLERPRPREDVKT